MTLDNTVINFIKEIEKFSDVHRLNEYFQSFELKHIESFRIDALSETAWTHPITIKPSVASQGLELSANYSRDLDRVIVQLNGETSFDNLYPRIGDAKQVSLWVCYGDDEHHVLHTGNMLLDISAKYMRQSYLEARWRDAQSEVYKVSAMADAHIQKEIGSLNAAMKRGIYSRELDFDISYEGNFREDGDGYTGKFVLGGQNESVGISGDYQLARRRTDILRRLFQC